MQVPGNAGGSVKSRVPRKDHATEDNGATVQA